VQRGGLGGEVGGWGRTPRATTSPGVGGSHQLGRERRGRGTSVPIANWRWVLDLDSRHKRDGPPPTRLWPSSWNLAKVGWAAALRAGRMPGKRPSRWPGAWQTAISLAGCLANGHLASPPWPNAWQTAISRGARIRERSPPREAVLTPPICAMAQCPANGHLVRAPPLRRPPRTLALGRLWGAGNAVLGRKNGNRPLCPLCGVGIYNRKYR